MQEFETASLVMQRMLRLTVQCPTEDVPRLAAVAKVAPLAMGKYDNNSYQSAAGIERYRPLDGAAVGAETDVRERQGVVEVGFELPDDEALIARVVEAVFQAHSYQEPVIRLEAILTSRSKGLDDSANPHRWWNTNGDWKAHPATQ